MVEKIIVITAGGTIDKIYGSGKGVRDMEIGLPAVEDIFEAMGLKNSISFEFISVARKDSLDMDDTDRARIVAACANSSSGKIIITHGTDTLLNTAAALSVSGLGNLKCIVITGALQPASMKHSDAEFNLGMALATCLSMEEHGIKVALNGIHDWDKCQKDDKTGYFVSLKELVH